MIGTRPGDEVPTTSKVSAAKLKEKASSTTKKTIESEPVVITKASATKLKEKSSSTTKKTKDLEPVVIRQTSVEDASLLCEFSPSK
jgi:hypothetical protein